MRKSKDKPAPEVIPEPAFVLTAELGKTVLERLGSKEIEAVVAFCDGTLKVGDTVRGTVSVARRDTDAAIRAHTEAPLVLPGGLVAALDAIVSKEFTAGKSVFTYEFKIEEGK